jgi:hypothetical protein
LPGDRDQNRAGLTPASIDSPETGAAAYAAKQALVEALEMGAGSLLGLEATLARLAHVPGEHADAEAGIRSAIELVRAALEELQLQGDSSSKLALGFVDRRRPRRKPPQCIDS